MSHGEFSHDNPQTEWAVAERPEDRNMRTLRDFWFKDPENHSWDAPAGSMTDGASIPRPLWSTVGSPFTGNYRRAAIVHDVACVAAGHDSGRRRAADRMFYHACRTGHCSVFQSIVLYVGVRVGAWMGRVPQWTAAREAEDAGPHIESAPAELRLQRDYQVIAQMVLQPGETDDIAEIERRTDTAMSHVTGVDMRER